MRVGSEVEKKDTIRKKAREYHQRGTPFLSFRWKRPASRAVTRLRRIGVHMAAGLTLSYSTATGIRDRPAWSWTEQTDPPLVSS